jgi:uncharacterized DUF497 family protein
MEADGRIAIFEWDEAKNRLNQDKHGISFEQARHAFADPKRLIFTGVDHSIGEERYFCLGVSGGGLMTVRFMYREQCVLILGASIWRDGAGILDTERHSLQ